MNKLWHIIIYIFIIINALLIGQHRPEDAFSVMNQGPVIAFKKSYLKQWAIVCENLIKSFDEGDNNKKYNVIIQWIRISNTMPCRVLRNELREYLLVLIERDFLFRMYVDSFNTKMAQDIYFEYDDASPLHTKIFLIALVKSRSLALESIFYGNHFLAHAQQDTIIDTHRMKILHSHVPSIEPPYRFSVIPFFRLLSSEMSLHKKDSFTYKKCMNEYVDYLIGDIGKVSSGGLHAFLHKSAITEDQIYIDDWAILRPIIEQYTSTAMHNGEFLIDSADTIFKQYEHIYVYGVPDNIALRVCPKK